MTNRELTKEKTDIRELLFSKIEKVKGKADLEEISKKVVALNDILDAADSRFSNLIDTIDQFFTVNQVTKIKKRINDILDNYDKTNKDGSPVYDDNKKQKIKELVKEIDDICNRNFWTRFKLILGIGS